MAHAHFAHVRADSGRVQGPINSRFDLTRKSVQRPHRWYHCARQLRRRWLAASCAASCRRQLAAGRGAPSTSTLAASCSHIHEQGATPARNEPQQAAYRASYVLYCMLVLYVYRIAVQSCLVPWTRRADRFPGWHHPFIVSEGECNI